MASMLLDEPRADEPAVASRHADLLHNIEHAAHLLPSQGPITVFVHHNTLHAFEESNFDQAVQTGGRLYGCHAYLPEDHYRNLLADRRIRIADLEAALLHDLGEQADQFVALFGTRYSLRLAMLQFPFRTGPTEELRWMIAETDALRRFRPEVDPAVRDRMITDSQRWVMRELQGDGRRPHPAVDVFADVWEQFDRRSIDSWSDGTWEAFVLNFLWRVCLGGLRSAELELPPRTTEQPPLRHRDVLLRATGRDADVLVHEVLIPFCGACLDQGFAEWELPDRDKGFFQSFLSLYGGSFVSPTRWSRDLHRETRLQIDAQLGPLESIAESLSLLGVGEEEQEAFITQSLLALRGWAGMIWQMETNAEWAPHPAPAGSLVEFLAVRLLLDRVALARVAREELGFSNPLDRLRDELKPRSRVNGADDSQRLAFTIFQLAQVRGWKPADLQHMSAEQWRVLVREIEEFPALERRRMFHAAFERKYRTETLDAVVVHSRHLSERPNIDQQVRCPAYQVVCCIDEREESFRRHLEEIDPDCETLGIAGFFGVAMYYRGLSDAHFKPLCPVVVKPRHYVVEEPRYSLLQAEQRRAEARRRIGQLTHRTHRGTRTFLGGLLTGLLGSLAAFPLVARILFPRTTARIRRMYGSMVVTPGTELRLERTEDEPGSANGQIGYTVDEMADIVEGGIRAIGLARPELISELVIICGHGSSSLNNPHEAAHDCGACGGGRGGPNARAFSEMANDPRVRLRLTERGLLIPNESFFVGAYHNTCDDSLTWYDLDRLPVPLRPRFERARDAMERARARSAHERCRRCESSDLSLCVLDSHRHVEVRAEDLSQTRPEYGHATNALCFVGRREWSRGLFLDRRAFLTSYDPTQDDERCSILEKLLQAVIPVCAGINLEYYFSYVDPTGYGCGTKLPHNITSLVGVMDGAASDLRPGLPWQMVEIHEPVRLLFVIETTPGAMQRIIDENAGIAQLVNGNWVQLTVFDAQSARVHHYVDGEFRPYEPESSDLPRVASSIDWYRGRRDHLGYAEIQPSGGMLS